MAAVESNYWVGVVSRSHVATGVAGGYIQLNHGRKAPLKRLKAGDGIVIYSPRTDYPDGEPLQAFTAIGRVGTGDIYQVTMTEDFKPYRVDVQFQVGRDAPVKPLIDTLSFIKSKTDWGAAFRYGHIQIPSSDFRQIAQAMGVDMDL